MLKSQLSRAVAAGSAILLFVLLLFVPRSPATEKGQTSSSESRSVDQEVQDAVTMMETENPMQGIMKLKDILEKDPKNIDASWALGQASMTTGQYEKAVDRYSNVITHDKEGKYFEAHLYLGDAYEKLGKTEQAIESYSRFLESESEPQLMQDVRERIAVLKKKS